MAHARFRCTNIYKSQSTNSISPRTHINSSITEMETEHINIGEEPKGLKRGFENDPLDLQSKKLHVEPKEENNNEESTSTRCKSISSGDGSDIPSVSNVTDTEVRDVGSAFRKVEKAVVREIISPVGDIQFSNKAAYNMNDAKMNLHKEHEIISRHLYNKGLLPHSSIANRLSVGIGMLSPGWMAPVSSGAQTYLDPRVYSERVHVSSANKPEMPSPVNKLSHDAIRNLQNGDMFSKQMLMEQLRKSHLPYMQTANPMVEKILQTATPTMVQRPIQPMSLAQNWCAKCNATFRMTSDLVYHMRSHHKREFDPIKKKREDKLQCNVCKETFKERHHLTRHMTSHT